MIPGGFKNMNTDKIIQCILVVMLKLEKAVNSTIEAVQDKLDRGGYTGTAQDLSDSIESIYQPDTVIRYTAPTRVGNTFTFPSGGYDVLLSKQFHTNTSELETTIAAATDGFKRIDLIYYKADDTIAKIQGTESATVAVRPEVPAGGIELCLINVFGATIEVPEVNGGCVKQIYENGQLQIFRKPGTPPDPTNKEPNIGDWCIGFVEGQFINAEYLGPDKTLLTSFNI